MPFNLDGDMQRTGPLGRGIHPNAMKSTNEPGAGQFYRATDANNGEWTSDVGGASLEITRMNIADQTSNLVLATNPHTLTKDTSPLETLVGEDPTFSITDMGNITFSSTGVYIIQISGNMQMSGGSGSNGYATESVVESTISFSPGEAATWKHLNEGDAAFRWPADSNWLHMLDSFRLGGGNGEWHRIHNPAKGRYPSDVGVTNTQSRTRVTATLTAGSSQATVAADATITYNDGTNDYEFTNTATSPTTINAGANASIDFESTETVNVPANSSWTHSIANIQSVSNTQSRTRITATITAGTSMSAYVLGGATMSTIIDGTVYTFTNTSGETTISTGSNTNRELEHAGTINIPANSMWMQLTGITEMSFARVTATAIPRTNTDTENGVFVNVGETANDWIAFSTDRNTLRPLVAVHTNLTGNDPIILKIRNAEITTGTIGFRLQDGTDIAGVSDEKHFPQIGANSTPIKLSTGYIVVTSSNMSNQQIRLHDNSTSGPNGRFQWNDMKMDVVKLA